MRVRARRAQPARWQQVPEGMRDLLPEEAGRRARLADALRDEFRRWGYREVVTPTLEFLETLLQGAGAGIQDRLFKIVDSRGELLALRPEMTVPIARLAATRLLQEGVRPLRVAYVAPVFRGQDAGRGRLREFTQAGVELLGDAGPDADAEVIALALECLARAGVREPVLHVGELGFLDDALDGVAPEEQEEIRARLYRREFAGIDAAASDPALSRFLRALPDLHGPAAAERAVAFARTERGRAALARLAAIIERLAEYGVPGRVTVDLSIIRDFSYYTGVVFEAYGPGTGYPLLGGGRYDTLVGRFGPACPATGFAIGVERVLAVCGDRAETGIDYLVVLAPDRRAAALEVARRLREIGKAVVVSAQAAGVEARAVIEVEGACVRVTDAATGAGRLLDREAFLAEVRGRPAVVSWTH